MLKPRIIFFDIDGTEPDLDDYFAAAKIAAWWDRAVGTCVAMANGSDTLKAAATHQCGSCAEDGIYHFCADNGLI